MMSINHLYEDLMAEKYSEIAQNQKGRLNFIDFRLFFTGQISRNDLIDRFGIKEAAATRDLTQYRELAPNNLEYSAVSKVYLASSHFTPLYIDHSKSRQILQALAYGIGDDFASLNKSVVPCEIPTQLNIPNVEILAYISRAIFQKRSIEITYLSQSSGKTKRLIAPFALVDNGLRWHVRAFDSKREDFRDFVINRIKKVTLQEQPQLNVLELKEEDIQWNRVVELELVPHPNLKFPEVIETEYDMKNGIHRMKIRAALAGYVLRKWNVDCTDNHSLKGQEYHLWLKNKATLYGVNNLSIAPGYSE